MRPHHSLATFYTVFCPAFKFRLACIGGRRECENDLHGPWGREPWPWDPAISLLATLSILSAPSRICSSCTCSRYICKHTHVFIATDVLFQKRPQILLTTGPRLCQRRLRRAQAMSVLLTSSRWLLRVASWHSHLNSGIFAICEQ